MTDKPKNPPAFPTEVEKHSKDFNMAYKVKEPGLTMLDYFAAKAMQGQLSHGGYSHEEVVHFSYKLAQAMLKERENYL